MFNLTEIIIDRSETYQEIYGFGGAFTDSTGFNVKSLSSGARDNLLKAYFSKNGLQYSLCRVPMGATDFSLKPYTYHDSKLERFKLQPEDFVYKVRMRCATSKIRKKNKFRRFR